ICKLSEEFAEYINSPSWNRPTFYNNDEEYFIQYKEYLENSSNAIAPVLPIEELEYSLKSLLNRDTLIDSSPKFDFLLEDFFIILAHIDLIPPGIEKADFDLEEEIRLVENLLYDNSSPRPPEELNAEIADTIVESLSEMSEEILQAKENLMKSIQTFLKKFNRISFIEMPKVLSQAWKKLFEIQHAQPEDTNELFQKLLEDLQI
nr:hypothetical protein [Tanacetum cinerariifolium]